MSLYTAALTDVLDSMGLAHQTLPPSIRPLWPGARVAGPAFTIVGRPARDRDYDASIRAILDALGQVPAGHVAVYATRDDASAHFGELSAVSLAARGAAGVVVDGGCRDVDRIAEEQFPAFARYTTPQDSVPRWEVTGCGGSVEIGGVRIDSGDWILGDADGVVVVPADVSREVLDRAAAVADTEDEVRAAVRRGMPPLEAYERFGKF